MSAARPRSFLFLLCAGVFIRSGAVSPSLGLVLQWLQREGSLTGGARQHMEGYFPGECAEYLY